MRKIFILILVVSLFACKKEENHPQHNRVYYRLNRDIDTCMCEGDTVVLDAFNISANSYNWLSFDNYTIYPSLPIKKLTSEEQGYVKVNNGINLLGSYRYNIQYFKFFCPNSFTPTGAGVNDFWRPVPVMGMMPLSYELSIFDDQSNRVFHSQEVNKGWDGKVNGHDPVSGIYYFNIKFTSPCGDKKTSNGIIQLIVP